MTTVKFGYWTVEVDEEITTPWLKNRYVCSQCGNWQTYGRTLFCPNCGAKMTMTYGDKIRAMTNVELAEYLAKVENYGQSAFDWLDWLQQEAKEGVL